MNDLTRNEFPSRRADVDLIRERTGIRLEGSAGLVKAKLDVTTDGSARSPASVAVTMLLLATAACVPPVLLGLVGWLVHAPAVLLTVGGVVLFAALFVTGTILAFRPDTRLPPAGGFTPVIVPRPAIQSKDGESSRRGGRKAIQNGRETKKTGQATTAGRPRAGRPGQPTADVRRPT